MLFASCSFVVEEVRVGKEREGEGGGMKWIEGERGSGIKCTSNFITINTIQCQLISDFLEKEQRWTSERKIQYERVVD